MPEKILVVDDDADSLKLIGVMLKREGYDVIGANAGTPGLQKAYDEQPNLIILDVMMPDMDGYEVTKRLRNEPTTAHIPIIMFTAKTLVDDKVAGFEAGADDYLTKPTHPAELASRVKAVLARAKAQGAGAGKSKNDGTGTGMTLGFLGVKGGVGTTTIASNIATALAKNGDTVLADVRPGQGTLGLMLGFNSAQSMANVLSKPTNNITQQVVAESLVPHQGGMKLLLSSVNPQESQMNIAPDALSRLTQILASMYRYTVLDLGAGLNRLNVRLIKEIDRTIIVLEPNIVSLLMAQSIINELETVNVNRRKLGVVICNRTQTPNQIPWQDVEQRLGLEVTAIISPAPDVAYHAVEMGVPMAHYQPTSIVAGQITKLAEEIAH